MSEPTSDRLAKALEAKNDPLLAGIIVRARRKYYDEYEGELATPLVQLVADLRAVGHKEFAQRVINGDFDASKAEAEAWYRREGAALVKNTPLERIFKQHD